MVFGDVCVSGPGGVSCLAWTTVLAYVAPFLVVLALGVGLLVKDARSHPSPSEQAQRANRHVTTATAVGASVMVACAVWVFGGYALGVVPRDGRVLATMPAWSGLLLLLVVTLGQLTWPRPSGVRREAELAYRTVADVVPSKLRYLASAWAVLLAVSLVVLGAAGESRVLLYQTEAAALTAEPYPGWYYGVPVIAANLALVAAAEFVVRLATSRPAVVGVDAAWDLQLRRRTATHVMRATQLMLGLSTAGVLAMGGRAHLELARQLSAIVVEGQASAGGSAQRLVGLSLVTLAVCCLLVSVVAAALPSRLVGWRRGSRVRDQVGP